MLSVWKETRARWAWRGGANSSPDDFHPGNHYGSLFILNIFAHTAHLLKTDFQLPHYRAHKPTTRQSIFQDASAHQKGSRHSSCWEPSLAFIHFWRPIPLKYRVERIAMTCGPCIAFLAVGPQVATWIELLTGILQVQCILVHKVLKGNYRVSHRILK